MEVIARPWGLEMILEANDKYAMKILSVQPGKRLSLQYHEVKIETMYIESGSGILYHKDHDTGVETNIRLTPGISKTIYPFDVHRLIADVNSPIPLRVLESSSPELGDVVRLEDDYGRL